MDLFSLSGKVALVTGASSGLGTQFARALARQGADIAIVARRVEKLLIIANEIRQMNRKCLAKKCDVTKEQDIKDTVAAVVKEYGKIDILVNNAGVVSFSNLADHTLDEWNNVLDTDLTGVFLFSREVGDIMAKQNYGKIINISSVGGLLAGAGQVSYYAAKAGVVNLTKALAAELAQYNVTVNSIGPGVFETEMTADTLDGNFTQYLNIRCPMKRIGQSGELDGALIYLASDASSYTTGQTIYVDGGMTSVL